MTHEPLLTEPISDYAQAVAFVTSLIRAEPTPADVRERIGLEPIAELLERLGDPHRGLECLHIAGSKGKGSTALIAERLLCHAGKRTGTFTSPHLMRWTERFRVGSRPVDDARFASMIETVRRACLELSGSRHAPYLSFFDVLSAAAFVMFRDAAVEVAVLETGLGGRLDATNVVQPRATCITTIELEHTDRLGTTLAAVAREKAGIIKQGVPLVLGRLAPAARAVVERRARALAVPVCELGREILVDADGGTGGHRVHLKAPGRTLEAAVEHPCPVMAENAALALASVAALMPDDLDVVGAAAQRELPQIRVPGRLDVVGERPLRVVDGAHTPDSMRRLSELLGALGAEQRHLVVSITQGKRPEEILRPLLDSVAGVTATRAEPTRSLPAAVAAQALRAHYPQLAVDVVEDPRAALRQALAGTPASGTLCACGSLYLAGIALEVLAPKRER